MICRQVRVSMFDLIYPHYTDALYLMNNAVHMRDVPGFDPAVGMSIRIFSIHVIHHRNISFIYRRLWA